MRVGVEVGSRQEGVALQVAMADPATRAFVLVVGTLLPLSPSQRSRVLGYVTEQLADDYAVTGPQRLAFAEEGQEADVPENVALEPAYEAAAPSRSVERRLAQQRG